MLRRTGPAIPPYSRAVVIYNPLAGKLRSARAHRLVRAAEMLQTVARDVLLIPTHGPRTAGALASNAIADGADLIIAAGGDGTISEVVGGMAYSRVPLGILPGGTANVLAHEIGVRRSVTGAARQIAGCIPTRVSLGQIETPAGELRYFILMAGAGFDAQIIYELSAGLKHRLGKLAYFLGGLGSVGRQLLEMEVVMESETRRCTFALISKVRNYGGDFEIAREVRLQEDRFEVVLFEGRNSWRYLRYLAGVATHTLAHAPGVHFSRASCLELRAGGDPRIFVQADGELIGRLPVKVRIVPDALTLLVPPPHR